MIISPNENGWSYDNSVGNWKLVYSGNKIVIYEQEDKLIATQITLFVGTQQECEDHINLLNLTENERTDESVEI
jgi:hypothetical protein